jgi:hypothetical protein
LVGAWSAFSQWIRLKPSDAAVNLILRRADVDSQHTQAARTAARSTAAAEATAAATATQEALITISQSDTISDAAFGVSALVAIRSGAPAEASGPLA